MNNTAYVEQSDSGAASWGTVFVGLGLAVVLVLVAVVIAEKLFGKK